MQIVIEIDNEHYERIMRLEEGVTVYPTSLALYEAVKNSIPLPKGHGDLKDADIYKAEVKKYITENKNSDDLYLAGCGDGAYHALHIYDCIPTTIKADRGENNEVSD